MSERLHAFAGTIAIAMTHPDRNVEIRYTLDDTYPTINSPQYKRPITLAQTTTVRASAFREGRKVAVRDAIIFTKVENLDSVKKRRRRDND